MNLLNYKNFVFLDCGAHVGQSISNFLKSSWSLDYNWNIHSFEAHPELFQKLSHYINNSGNYINKYSNHNLSLHNKAVSTKNGLIDFYPTTERYPINSNKNPPGMLWGSSSLVKSKTTGNLDKINPIKVESIDLSSWIKNNFNIYDFIILKMDIEGEEYSVLNKMIDDNTICYINYLYIEFHWDKINLDFNIHQSLLDKLNSYPNLNIIIEKPGHINGNWFNNE